jgi:cell division protein FtsZ
MKEFEDVGNTVSDLASEDATVVVGTVIDPDLGDQIRVTVVATGLGDSMRASARTRKPVRLVANGTTGRMPMEVEERDLYEPVLTDRDQRLAQVETKQLFAAQSNMDYLDIPAFLRNQAD